MIRTNVVRVVLSFLLTFFFYCPHLLGQPYNYLWSTAAGSTNADEGSAICHDGFGNVYVAGSWEGTMSIAPSYNISSQGGQDIFLAKYTSTGTLVWVVKYSSINDDAVVALQCDLMGNVYLMGTYWGWIDLNPNQISWPFDVYANSTPQNIFLVKVDFLGNMVWGYSPDGLSSMVSAPNVMVVRNGYVSIVCNITGTVDLDPGTATVNMSGNGDGLVLCLDENNGYVFAKKITGSINFSSIDRCQNGDVLISGTFTGTVDFDPSTGVSNLSTSSLPETFVVKWNGFSSLAWAHKLPTSVGASVVLDDHQGGVINIGQFSATVDFDHGTLPTQVYSMTAAVGDIFFRRIDASGNFVSASRLSCTSFCGLAGAKRTERNDISVFGAFQGNTDFDPGPGVQGGSSVSQYGNGYILILDSLLAYNWHATLEGGQNRVADVDLTEQDQLYATGYFDSNVDLNPGTGNSGTTGNGGADYFAFGWLDQNVGLQENGQPVDHIQVYPNPFESFFSVYGEMFAEGATDVSLNVRSLDGRIVASIYGYTFGELISLEESIAPGTYLLEICVFDYIQSTQIIIKQ